MGLTAFKIHRKGVSYRVVCAMLAVVVLFVALMPSTVYAAEATEGERINTSMHNVAKSLAEFASEAVNINANDKHVDTQGTNTGGITVNHQLVELGNQFSGRGSIPSNASTDIGDAAGIVGFTDSDYTWLSATANKAMVSMSYSNFDPTTSAPTKQSEAGIGDDGHAYAYVRYGHLLNELGLDATGNESGGAGRGIVGFVVQLAYLGSDFVPIAFDFVINILDFLNPFRFLINEQARVDVITGETPWKETGTVAEGSVAVGNTFEDPDKANDEYYVAGNAPTTSARTDVTASDIGIATDTQGTTNAVFQNITNITTQLYIWFRNLGMVVVLPFCLALLAFMILMKNSGMISSRLGNGGRVMRFLTRFVFILIGVPLLGLMYTSVLNQMEASVSSQTPSSRIVACTFVDFEGWVKASRLDPPSAAGSTVELVSTAVSSTDKSGTASSETWRTLRETIYQINYETGLYCLPSDSNLGISLGSGSSDDWSNYDVYAGMVDANGQWTSELVFTETGGTAAEAYAQLNSLLGNYSKNTFYTAAAWESGVNAALSSIYRANLGTTSASADSSSNKKTIYQMYYDTDDLEDWLNREILDNVRIFYGVSSTSGDDQEVPWSGEKFNLFSNGSNFGNDKNVYFSNWADITYKHSVDWYHSGATGFSSGATTDMLDPGNKGGLSTIGMYNYLSSTFGDSTVTVYDPEYTSSEFTHEMHYSVSSAGSGLIGWLFLGNCLVVLLVYVIIGFVFCGSLLVHNIKYGFTMLLKLPGALLGSVSMIMQVISYVFVMVIELFMDVFLYWILTELVMVFASMLEGPIMNAVTGASGAVVGGIPAAMMSNALTEQLAEMPGVFMAGFAVLLVGLVLIGVGLVKLNRPFVMAWAYLRVKVYRLVTCEELLPAYDDLVAEMDSLYVWDDIACGINRWLDRTRSDIGTVVCPAYEGGAD